MASTALVVLTSFGSSTDAREFVRYLVEARLVACGTVVPATSIYRWGGQITAEAEVLVVLKTDAARWDALEAAVRERHPYQLPELLALPVERGLGAYLSWVGSEVTE